MALRNDGSCVVELRNACVATLPADATTVVDRCPRRLGEPIEVEALRIFG
jgi:hypothetical protein